MDKREQLKFVLMIMSMSSCVAYSYGMIKLPILPMFRRTESRALEAKTKDHRNDGGTVSRTITNMDLTVTDRVDLLTNSE